MSFSNKVILVGHVGTKIGLVELEGGNKVIHFNLRISETFTFNNKRKEEITWHQITAWNSNAEIISKHVRKGDLLGITGRLTADSYERDGLMIKSYAIVVEEVQLFGADLV